MKISMRKFSLMAFLIATSILGTAQIRRIPANNKATSDSSKHALSTDSSKLDRNVFLKELNLTREQQLKLKEIKNATIDSTDRINNDPGMENPFQNKKPLKLYQFRPSAPLGGGAGGLEFDPQVMKGMLQKGIGTANDFIAKMSQEPADLSWT